MEEKIMHRILIVEDNRPVANLIATYLNFGGYETSQVYDGQLALELLAEEPFDLLILDLMLPKVSGTEIIERVKETEIPIIVLTARDDLGSKVQCLKTGADDYIIKPFDSMDLLVRVEALLRRCRRGPQTVHLGSLLIEPSTHEVTLAGRRVELAPKEYDLLYYLASRHDQVLTRKDILARVWGYQFAGETRTVDIHIQRLRRKMGWTSEIQTVTKIGYLLKESEIR